jgi:uncharacterized protein (TIGR00661 family)
MNQKLRILVCPLDWGLGHATRCVPVIRELQRQGAEVILAADNRPFGFFKKEFPELETIRFPGFNVRYPAGANMVVKMALSAPGFIIEIIKENQRLKKLVSSLNIDGVISDNRFGLWNKQIPCVYISHQINIISPVLERLINSINHFFISRYMECWIPDHSGKGKLSGRLSESKRFPANASFIGPLSRFTEPTGDREKKYEFAVILSGPEPQRTIFESLLVKEFKNKPYNVALVRGVTESDENYILGNIEVFSHLNTTALQEVIESSEVIVSRPGYSTIMDLAVLNKKAVFVPTPGQTEQEYLGKYLATKGIGIYQTQEKFNIDNLMLSNPNNEPISSSLPSNLKESISRFLSSCRNKCH